MEEYSRFISVLGDVTHLKCGVWLVLCALKDAGFESEAGDIECVKDFFAMRTHTLMYKHSSSSHGDALLGNSSMGATVLVTKIGRENIAGEELNFVCVCVCTEMYGMYICAECVCACVRVCCVCCVCVCVCVCVCFVCVFCVFCVCVCVCVCSFTDLTNNTHTPLSARRRIPQ